MEAKQLDYDDMVFMPEFTGPLALDNVENRFKKNKIYTSVSSILISINPYADLGLYTKEMYDYYQYNKTTESPPPHVFGVAKVAYRQMLFPSEQPRNQSLLISGESGAGKTETTKLFLRYFAKQSEINAPKSEVKEKVTIEGRILQANPILEAFGNAKTLRNDNSSRFGRWLNVYFSDKGQIMMGSMTKYLLEESRVVFQDKGERNYNVFYQVCAAWEKEITADESVSMDPKNLEYLNKSGCYSVKGVSDYLLYEEMMQCFEQLGFNEKEQSAILKILKSVLCLGNIVFEEGPVVKGKGSSKVSEGSKAYLNTVAKCLSLTPLIVERILTIQDLTMPSGSFYSLPREKSTAESSRHALSKSLYGRLFSWLVERINIAFRSSYSGKQDPESMRVIGILDIFGFEAFKHNSFEQLCINLANEKLQQYFVEQVFKMELQVYKEEGIDVKEIPYPDNSDTLALLEKKGGVFVLLKDELKVKTGSDMSYVTKLQKAQKKHPKFIAPRMMNDPHFTIKHFAEDVVYSAEGFLAKNRSKLTQDVIDGMKASDDPIIVKLFTEIKKEKDKNEGKRKGHRKKKKRGAASLAAQFQSQLNKLIATIRDTESHFVRCIKPNKEKKAGKVDRDEVIRQLTTCGVIDAVTVRKLGYTNRMSHWAFFKRYGIINGGKIYHEKGIDFKAENKKMCDKAEALVDEKIKKKIPIALFQSGTNLMFYKSEILTKLENLLREVQDKAAHKIGSVCRMHIQRRRFLEMQDAHRKLQAAVKNPSYTLEQIDECLERCRKVGVIERLIKEAEKKIAALIQARNGLRKALTTHAPSLKSRLEMFVTAVAAAAPLIPTATEIAVIKEIAPLLKTLLASLGKYMEDARKDKKYSESLRYLVTQTEAKLKAFDCLKINIRDKEEIKTSLAAVQALDDMEKKLLNAMNIRDIMAVETGIKEAQSGVANGSFERQAFKDAKDVAGALHLEMKVKNTLETGNVDDMEKIKEKVEKEMKMHPTWPSQTGCKLSDQMALIAKALLHAKRMRDAILRLSNAITLAPSMGEKALNLLQDGLGAAKMLFKEAEDQRLSGNIVSEISENITKGETELKATMERMNAAEQVEARKRMEDRERKLKERREAELAREKAEEEAAKQMVEQKVAQMNKEAEEQASKMKEEAIKKLDEHKERASTALKAKDEIIAQKGKEIEAAKKRAANAEAETKAAKSRYDALMSPDKDNLEGCLRAAILKHSMQIKDYQKLVSFYLAAVLKGLEGELAPAPLQVQQLQKLMTRPEVQSSGAVQYVENAVRTITNKISEGKNGNEAEYEEEEDDPPSPPALSPPPSPKWKQKRRESFVAPPPGAVKAALEVVTSGNTPAFESKDGRKSYVISADGDIALPTKMRSESFAPPPLEESSSDDEMQMPPPTNFGDGDLPPPPPPRKTESNCEPSESQVSIRENYPKISEVKGHSRSATQVPASQRFKFTLKATHNNGQFQAACAPLIPNADAMRKMSLSAAKARKLESVPSKRLSMFRRFGRKDHKRSATSLSPEIQEETRKSKVLMNADGNVVIIPDLANATVIREGYLRKRGGVNADKALKKRFFKLKKYEEKYYFTYHNGKHDRKELGVMLLTGALVSAHATKDKYFRIETPEVFGNPSRVYLIKAESSKHRDIWLQQLNIYCKPSK